MEAKELRIALSGRLDSANSTAWCEETSARVKEVSATDLVLDCSELEYISSMGLRALLTIRKAGCAVHCVETSPVVYEIFEETGFTALMDIRKAYRRIQLKDDALIARGTVGLVYRLDEDRVVKVFNRRVTLDLIQRERQYGQKVLQAGIQTLISYDIVRVDDCYGIIFEMARAEAFSRRLKEAPERFDDLAARYADLLKQLHATHMAPGELPDAKAIYHRYADDSAAYLRTEEIEALHGLIDSVPDRYTVLHGDYHANNVMFQDSELMLIDLGDVSLGHPIFDLASMYVSHILVGAYRPEFILAGMGIDTDTCRRLWDRVLRLYFPGAPDSALREKEDLIRRFAHLKLAVMYAIAPGLEQYVTWKPLEDARAVLFPGLEAMKAELRQDSLC